MHRLPATVVAAALALALPLIVGCGAESEKDLIASAQSALAKKDRPAAIINLKNAIAKNGDSGQARYLLGKTLLESGDPVAALVELVKADELGVEPELVAPEMARARLAVGETSRLIAHTDRLQLKDSSANADLYTSLAAAYATQSNLDAAREAINVALRSKPDYAPGLVVRAKLDAQAGDTDAALAQLEALLTKDPSHEGAGVLRGELLLVGKNDPAAALAAYEKVLVTNPSSLTANAAVITLLLRQGKIDPAKAQLATLRKAAPNHPETAFFDAQIAFMSKDFKRARELTDSILKVMPDNVPALRLAGAAELALGRDTQAQFFLGKALKAAPGLLDARHLLAQSFLRSNLPNKSIEVLKPILESNKVDGASLSLAGEAWLQMGDATRADAAFQAAAKSSPGNTRVQTTALLSQVARGNSAALLQLEALATGDPGTRTDMALISARLAQKDLPGALKAIDSLEKKLPNEATAQILRGRVLLAQGKPADAARAFEAALVKQPLNFAAIASLAAVDMRSGRADLARKRFEDLIKAQPKSSRAYLALAELSAQSGGKFEDVSKHLRAGVEANAGEAASHLALITYLMNAGDTRAAVAAAQAATGALPDDLAIMDTLGRAQIASGDGQQAVSTFKKLAALQPTQAQHQVRLAEAHIAVKEKDAAERALRRALELKPDLPLAQRGLVGLAVMDKRHQDALVMVRAMQKANPKDGMAYSLEGDVEASRQAWPAAITLYRTALRLSPNSDTVVKLHGAHRRAGQRAEADRMAAEWLKTHPQDTLVLYYLGDVAMAAKDAPLAEARYRALLDVQPNNALALNNVAWLMVQQGKPGAVAVAEKATTLLPDRALLMDTLATALAAENQLPKAISVQTAAVTLSGGIPAFKLNLARVYLKAGEKAKARTELEALKKLGEAFAGQAEVDKLLKSL